MKKILISFLLIALSLCTQAGFASETFELTSDAGGFSVQVPIEWAYMTPEGDIPQMMVQVDEQNVIMMAKLKKNISLSPDDPFMPFLGEGKILFQTERSTPNSEIMEKYTISDFPAFRVNMVGQAYEMIWIENSGDLYFIMYPNVNKNHVARIVDMANTFKIITIDKTPLQNEQDYTFKLLQDGTVALTKYTGSAKYVMTPQTIKGKQVTQIGDQCFYETGVLHVIISENVRSMGTYVFSGCTALEKVVLPPSLLVLPQGTFESCIALQNVQLPKNLEEIQDGAFFGTMSLTQISFPNSVKKIGPNNFVAAYNMQKFIVSDNCAGLSTDQEGTVLYTKNFERLIAYAPTAPFKSYTLNKNTKSIDTMAFSNAFALQNIVLNEGLEKIALGAFFNTSLKEIYIPKSVTSIGTMEGMTIENEKGELEEATGEGQIFSTPIMVYGEENSSAQTYAQKFELAFRVRAN